MEYQVPVEKCEEEEEEEESSSSFFDIFGKKRSFEWETRFGLTVSDHDARCLVSLKIKQNLTSSVLEPDSIFLEFGPFFTTPHELSDKS